MTGDLAGMEQWAGFKSRSRIRQDNSLDVRGEKEGGVKVSHMSNGAGHKTVY